MIYKAKTTNKNLIPLFIIYQLFQIVLLPFFVIYLLIRKIRQKPIGSIKERLGFVSKQNKLESTIWIHAVSVGEILSIQNLINRIKKESPNISIYITTGTVAGKEIASKNLSLNYLSFLPFDFLISMFLAFKRIKPKAIIIVESEIWPNFLILSKLFKIPTYSLNARISERSKPRYKKLKCFFQPLFNIFKIIFVQSSADKENFEQLGVATLKVTVLGNLKAQNVLVKKETFENPKLANSKQFKTLLVGSVHPGELDIYLNLFTKLKTSLQELKLILAPRHFEWKEELIRKTNSLKFSCYTWESKDKASIEDIANKILPYKDIIIVCKLGELFQLYQLSDLFFLGGTFVPVGGHNLLEPAVWRKPSIIGPYYHNCKDIADKLEKENALIKVKTEQDLINQTEYLLKNTKTLEKMGNSACSWLKKEANAVQKNLDVLINEIKTIS